MGYSALMAARLTAQDKLNRAVSERELMDNFMNLARLNGWKTMHVSDSRRMVNQGGRMVLVGDAECKGWPDLFLAHERTGRMLVVEVKRELETVTDAQADWLNVFVACGVDTFVLRPSNWETGAALLKTRVPVAV